MVDDDNDEDHDARENNQRDRQNASHIVPNSAVTRTRGAIAVVHAIFFVHILLVMLLDKRPQREKHGAHTNAR